MCVCVCVCACMCVTVSVCVYVCPRHRGNTRRMDRSLHLLFWQRLLSSGARTADPDRAEWFYVPVRVRGPRDSALLIRALEYVNATWPYSRRLNGQRHFAFHLGK